MIVLPSGAEQAQLEIRNNLVALLSGKQPIKMDVIGFPVSNEAVDLQLRCKRLTGITGVAH